ncbi:MAG: putative amidophosphoribosyltransferase [Halocynthiibacter sp.]|jgi:predicted amidophosphoribosyltransferase
MAKMQTVLRLLYPPHCLGCNSVVAEEGALCGDCWRETSFLSGALCDACASPLPGEAEDGALLYCDRCMEVPRPWDHGRAAMIYSGTGKRLILGLKNSGRTDLAAPAGRWIAQAARGIVGENTLVAPVPTHWLRRVQRRFCPSELIANEVGKALNLSVAPDLLLKPRRTRKMQGLTPYARYENARGAFKANPRHKLRMAGRHILLIDDVMTSGATLTEASEICLEAGAHKVSVAVLARVADEV